MGTVRTLYFSPTGTSRALAQTIGGALSEALTMPQTQTDWTLPAAREPASVSLAAGDVLVLAFPVYGGRMPALLEPLLRALRGSGTPAIVAAVYGNRDYDDALREACDLLTAGGFAVCAAGAFIGEHSLSRAVASGRPDARDLAVAADFAARAAEKLREKAAAPVSVRGNFPYKARSAGASAHPKTSRACTSCGLCVRACPMGIICEENPFEVADGCLHCGACIKICPVNAKSFTDVRVLAIKTFLETTCKVRKEPELFL